MPTLLEPPEPAAVADPLLDEAQVEAFDLERLALLSEPPAIEPPRFALLDSEPRFRLRRMVVTAFLAGLIVTGLATLRPDISAPGPIHAAGTAVYDNLPGPARSTTTADACPVAD